LAKHSGKARAQRNIINVLRSYLAGFSKQDIIQDMFTEATKEAIRTFLDEIVELVPVMRLTDPATGERYAPEVWNVRTALGLPLNVGVQEAELEAIAKAVVCFKEGDYDECARVSSEGCPAFGKHIFHQLCLISYLRLGRLDAAGEAFDGAKISLQHTPWHLSLAKLTFGQASWLEVLKESRDENSLFQARIFDGFRDFTEGRPALARQKLTLAKTMAQDLPFEYSMLLAELDRLG